jgi:hypothetical protein
MKERSMSKLRSRLGRSPIARGAALPLRAAMVARYDARVIGRSLDWLVHERETTNLTYDLAELNRDQLGWFVSTVSGAEIGQVRAWMHELDNDLPLSEHISTRLSSGPRRHVSATEAHWGRRLGWYALVRALGPERVVETGTHLGLGSCAIAAALLRNGHGRLTTIDVDPDAGQLIGPPWAEVIDRRIGSSVELLAELGDVDIFVHDSLHTYEYETAELAAVSPHLRDGAVILSDNAHDSSALSDWAERSGLQYLFFKEQPSGHWWPGDGIGVAWKARGHGNPRPNPPTETSGGRRR